MSEPANKDLEGIPTRDELLETALLYARQAEARAILKLNKSDSKAHDLFLLKAIRDSIIFIRLAQCKPTT